MQKKKHQAFADITYVWTAKAGSIWQLTSIQAPANWDWPTICSWFPSGGLRLGLMETRKNYEIPDAIA